MKKYLFLVGFLALTACAGDDGVNGANGLDGQPGVQGPAGTDGTNVLLFSYSLSTQGACVNVDPGIYAKRVDTDETKLYSNSTCSNASQIDTQGSLCPAVNEIFVVSNSAILFISGSGSNTTIKKLVYQ